MISLIGGVRYTADTPVVLRLHGSTALRLWGSTEWFLNNVARNSLAIISNIEMESLELQRLWATSKNDRVKLRATFGWVSQERGAYRRCGRACDTAGHTMRTRRAPVRFLQSWSRGSSTMSHVIPLRLFQTLKSSRWNCNVCGLCRKMTVLNYVRLLGECPRKGEAYRQRGRADNAGVHTMRPGVQTTLPGTRQIPAVVVPWFLNNVARNSLVIISNIEIGSLELQRLWAMSKNDRVKLRATFG